MTNKQLFLLMQCIYTTGELICFSFGKLSFGTLLFILATASMVGVFLSND